MNGELQLKVSEVTTRNGNCYQRLEIEILNDSGFIQPDVLPWLKLPAKLDLSRGIILWGAAPTWLVCFLVERCQDAPWVGCYHLQSGSVVIVASNSPDLAIAETFRFVPERVPGNALFVGGPPDSGKSVKADEDSVRVYVLDAGALKRTITYGSEQPRQDKAIIL